MVIPTTGVDPGFPAEGGAYPRQGHFTVKTYVETKELGPVGGVFLDPLIYKPHMKLEGSSSPISYMAAESRAQGSQLPLHTMLEISFNYTNSCIWFFITPINPSG